MDLPKTPRPQQLRVINVVVDYAFSEASWISGRRLRQLLEEGGLRDPQVTIQSSVPDFLCKNEPQPGKDEYEPTLLGIMVAQEVPSASRQLEVVLLALQHLYRKNPDLRVYSLEELREASEELEAVPWQILDVLIRRARLCDGWNRNLKSGVCTYNVPSHVEALKRWTFVDLLQSVIEEDSKEGAVQERRGEHMTGMLSYRVLAGVLDALRRSPEEMVCQREIPERAGIDPGEARVALEELKKRAWVRTNPLKDKLALSVKGERSAELTSTELLAADLSLAILESGASVVELEKLPPHMRADEDLVQVALEELRDAGAVRLVDHHGTHVQVIVEPRLSVYVENVTRGRGRSWTVSEQEAEMSEKAIDPRKVFVVHGRNANARDAMFDFLGALRLDPIEWSEARLATGKPTPYVGEILDAAFGMARAIVVLMSPDDVVHLREELWAKDEEQHEKTPSYQARPNVLFEAGIAMGGDEERTVLVELGRIRPFSDVSGRHVVRMDNSAVKRKELAERLRSAGCEVNMDGDRWLSTGDFDRALEGMGARPGEARESVVSELSEADQAILHTLTRVVLEDGDRSVPAELIMDECGVTSEGLKDSAEFLESKGLITPQWVVGGIRGCRITPQGMEARIREFVPDYDALRGEVVVHVGKANVLRGEELARATGKPLEAINHILRLLEAEGMVELSAESGVARNVGRVRAPLKRLAGEHDG